jgi:hypothetical protein
VRSWLSRAKPTRQGYAPNLRAKPAASRRVGRRFPVIQHRRDDDAGEADPHDEDQNRTHRDALRLLALLRCAIAYICQVGHLYQVRHWPAVITVTSGRLAVGRPHHDVSFTEGQPGDRLERAAGSRLRNRGSASEPPSQAHQIPRRSRQVLVLARLPAKAQAPVMLDDKTKLATAVGAAIFRFCHEATPPIGRLLAPVQWTPMNIALASNTPSRRAYT